MSPNTILPALAGMASVGYDMPAIKETMPAMHEKNFKWRNQRQVRKNSRRAHAAGYKRAFA